MAEETFLSRSTAREWATAAIKAATIPAATGASGTYQSPAKSKVLAAIESCFAGEGLTRASHMQAWMDVVEKVRVNVYTAAASGSYEDPELNLSRKTAKLLPQADLMVLPATARTLFDLVKAANFTP